MPFQDIHLEEKEGIRKGDIVSYVSESYSRHNAPIRPEVYRLRFDREWSELVFESKLDDHSSLFKRSPSHELNRTSFFISHSFYCTHYFYN